VGRKNIPPAFLRVVAELLMLERFEQMKHDPNIHHRRSIRLKGYDYSGEGGYHVVVRTKKGVCMFGEVEGDRMRLSPVGEIAERCWKQIPDHFNKARLDVFQIMPNHIHGIIVIGDKVVFRPDGARKDVSRLTLRKDVPTLRMDVQLNVHTEETQRTMSGISPHKGALSVIMRTYKAAVTTLCRVREASQDLHGTVDFMTISYVMAKIWTAFASTSSTTRGIGRMMKIFRKISAWTKCTRVSMIGLLSTNS
jgi:REP element-mobilizing transposase RayT